jgi:hypothetical protein
VAFGAIWHVFAIKLLQGSISKLQGRHKLPPFPGTCVCDGIICKEKSPINGSKSLKEATFHLYGLQLKEQLKISSMQKV